MKTENGDKQSKTPNEELGEIIMQEMCNAGIIDPEDKGIYEITFAGGEKIGYKVSDEQ